MGQKRSRPVVQLLRTVRKQPLGNLFLGKIVAPCPVKGSRGKETDHGVIRMKIDIAVATKGQHYVRPKAPEVSNQSRGDLGKVLAHQGAIGIVQHLTMVDAQYAQCCGELLSPQKGELVVVAGIASMRSRTALCEADHAGFDATLVGQHQGAAKGSTLIIRVGSKTHESKRQWG